MVWVKLGSQVNLPHSRWGFPKMMVPPKHPKMIILSRKTYGCWVPPQICTVAAKEFGEETHQVSANPKPSNMPGNHRGRTIPGGWRRPGRLCLHATFQRICCDKKPPFFHETTFLFGNGINVCTPSKTNILPLKNGAWKTFLLKWVPFVGDMLVFRDVCSPFLSSCL